MDNLKEKANKLIDFIYNSPTAYHAVESIKSELESEGFRELKLKEQWHMEKSAKYFVTSGDTALIAFKTGTGNLAENGFRIIGAHTDSPCFKIKPVNGITAEGTYVKLNTEVYGGPILSTWFDRPLSIAGKITMKSSNIFEPIERMININRPLVIIPNIAIHLNREVNDGYKINPQEDTLPLLSFVQDTFEKEDYLLNLIAEEISADKNDILDFELFLYEFEKGCIMGLNNEFISSPRLDDLWMVHAGLKALTDAEESPSIQLLACVDHEEIGSQTAQGADSMFLLNILKRINLSLSGTEEDFYRALSNSMAISADLAHGVHPNGLKKHDPTNRPVLGKGPVLKYSAKQKYITTARTSAIFQECCNKAGVPFQKYANRSDIIGGGTIAKFLSSVLCMDVVDMGAPLLSMHSVRELAAVIDNDYTQSAFKEFFTV